MRLLTRVPRTVPARRRLLTEPLLPAAVWAVIVVAAAILGWEVLAWAGFGGAAGYALSGSV